MSRPPPTPAGRQKRNFAKRHVRPSDDGAIYLYGLHTVEAALGNAKRKKVRLLATPNALARLGLTEATAPVPLTLSTPRDLDRLVGNDAVHQGAVLEVQPLARPTMKALAEEASLIVLLDQVTDPHNVGAILRTACAFAADAVITTARYAPQETGVLAKSASGALDQVAFIEVRNLGEAITELQAEGFFVAGLDSEAEKALPVGRPAPKTAIVLGAEGKGLRQKTRELSNAMYRLDMPGTIKSLNVSNAAAICLFALSR
ncbi:MAG: RNA methyltransferase [Hyphomicrobiaceae bacterium]|nr:RNA methyltransferase [Hyphomicrobiaceae bacterium]